MHFSGNSYTGRRKTNEDSYLSIHINPNVYCYAIADGMGGGTYGEIASKLVIEELELFIRYQYSKIDKIPNLKDTMNQTFSYIQKRFLEFIEENDQYSGMGTTLCILLVDHNRYVWGNIGDSRIYRFNKRKIKQITRDHTLLEEMKKNGKKITPEIKNQYAHLLTKCISNKISSYDVFPDEDNYQILNQDEGFLLCSDGLIINKSDDIWSKNILQIINSKNSLQEKTNQLISYAYNNGSNDNISTIITFNYKDITTKTKKKSLKVLLILTGILVLFASVYILLNYHNYNNNLKTETRQIKFIDDSLWMPFSKKQLILTKSETYLSWEHYPYFEQLSYYRISVYDTNYHKLYDNQVEKRKNYYKLKKLERPGKYFITLNALLLDGTFRSDSIVLETKSVTHN